MTTETLHKKVSRYLQKRSLPAETRQIHNWLSTSGSVKASLTEEDIAVIKNEILAEVQAYTAYPLFHPKPAPWWKKITAIF